MFMYKYWKITYIDPADSIIETSIETDVFYANDVECEYIKAKYKEVCDHQHWSRLLEKDKTYINSFEEYADMTMVMVHEISEREYFAILEGEHNG
jgi:hypothetical protein